jgi:hypothetical protein
MGKNDHTARRPGRTKRRDGHMTTEPEKTLDPIAVELAGTRLLLRALIAYLLVDDPDEADHAVAALIIKIDRMAAAAVIASDPAGEASKPIRDSALALIADLRKSRGRTQ